MKKPKWIEYNGDVNTLPGWYTKAKVKIVTRDGRTMDGKDPVTFVGWYWKQSPNDILRYQIISND